MGSEVCGVALPHIQLKVSFSISSVAETAGGHKGAVFRWVAHLGAPGVFGVSFFDATVVPLAIPGSTDLLLLWLISNGKSPYLLVACAVAGSLTGGYTTWRLGKKGGDAAFKRWVPPQLQDRIRGWGKKHSILSVLVPAVLPPPMPLWPFLLAAGALGATRQRFLAAFGSGRTLRYGLVGWLGMTYGRRMVRLWAAVLDKWGTPVLCVFLTLTILGFILSFIKLRRTQNSRQGQPVEHIKAA
jgi:membrane protein YqaA with SNARE-associated domain